MKLIAAISLLYLTCFMIPSQAQRAEDEVKLLPGQSFQNLSSKWYSGHFNVSRGRHLHYLYVESLDKPETDPVLIYFNGGPGGASIFLNFAIMGPYVSRDGYSNLTEWDFSWNRRANLLLIDNPAGVGYSYAEKSKDIN